MAIARNLLNGIAGWEIGLMRVKLLWTPGAPRRGVAASWRADPSGRGMYRRRTTPHRRAGCGSNTMMKPEISATRQRAEGENRIETGGTSHSARPTSPGIASLAGLSVEGIIASHVASDIFFPDRRIPNGFRGGPRRPHLVHISTVIPNSRICTAWRGLAVTMQGKRPSGQSRRGAAHEFADSTGRARLEGAGAHI